MSCTATLTASDHRCARPTAPVSLPEPDTGGARPPRTMSSSARPARMRAHTASGKAGRGRASRPWPSAHCSSWRICAARSSSGSASAGRPRSTTASVLKANRQVMYQLFTRSLSVRAGLLGQLYRTFGCGEAVMSSLPGRRGIFLSYRREDAAPYARLLKVEFASVSPVLPSSWTWTPLSRVWTSPKLSGRR